MSDELKIEPCPHCASEMRGDADFMDHPKNDCFLSEWQFCDVDVAKWNRRAPAQEQAAPSHIAALRNYARIEESEGFFNSIAHRALSGMAQEQAVPSYPSVRIIGDSITEHDAAGNLIYHSVTYYGDPAHPPASPSAPSVEAIEHGTLKREAFVSDLAHQIYLSERVAPERSGGSVGDYRKGWGDCCKAVRESGVVSNADDLPSCPAASSSAAPSDEPMGAGDPMAFFADFCERNGYPSDSDMDAALQGAFYEGIRYCSVHTPAALAAPAPTVAAPSEISKRLREYASAAPRYQLVTIATRDLIAAADELDRLAAPAPTVESVGAAVPDMAQLEDVVRFLMGDEPLEGVNFGERHPTKAGLFWWRLNLRAAMFRAKG